MSAIGTISCTLTKCIFIYPCSTLTVHGITNTTFGNSTTACGSRTAVIYPSVISPIRIRTSGRGVTITNTIISRTTIRTEPSVNWCSTTKGIITRTPFTFSTKIRHRTYCIKSLVTKGRSPVVGTAVVITEIRRTIFITLAVTNSLSLNNFYRKNRIEET